MEKNQAKKQITMENILRQSMDTLKSGTFIILVMAGDYVGYLISLSLAYWIRVRILGPWIHLQLMQSYGDFVSMIWMPAVVFGVFWYDGLYNKRLPFWEEAQKIVRSLFLSFLGVLALISIWKISSEVSRAVTLETGLFALVFIPLIRSLWKPFLHQHGIGIERVIIVGDENFSSLVAFGLDRDHYMGLRAIGWMRDLDLEKENVTIKKESTSNGNGLSHPVNNPIQLTYLGNIASIPDIAKGLHIENVFVAYPFMKGTALSQLVSEIQKHVYSVYIIPNISQVNLISSELLYFFYEEIFFLRTRNNLKSRANRQIKTILDYTISLTLFILVLPLMVAIGMAIRLSSKGPAIYSQLRVGKDGKIFRILKFRTMHEGSEDRLSEILDKDPKLSNEYNHKRKLRNDPRVTAIGRFLRSTSLDELPQLINILKGDMSLVGPRPAFEGEMTEFYREKHAEYCIMKPGITGLWQVSGRSDHSFDMRVRLDSWYIRNWSLWLDLVILIRTIGVVFTRKGSY